MKKLFLIFLLLFFVFLIPSLVRSQERLAVCDLCGYCQNQPPPSNWKSCAQCLYPNISNFDDPSTNETLIIDPQTNLPPTPAPGRWYTFLGCINTNLGSFEQEGAAASVTQLFLNIIFSLVGGAALISLLYGAFVLLTSQNNPEKINQGKRIIVGAVAGLIFAVSAVFLVNFIGEKVLKLPGFQSPSASP